MQPFAKSIDRGYGSRRAVAGIWRVRGISLSGIDLPMGQPTQNAVLDAYGSCVELILGDPCDLVSIRIGFPFRTV